MPVTLYAARRGGTRYHRYAECNGLNSTAASGDPIDPVTRTQAIDRKLLPCALCDPPRIVALSVVT